MILSLSKDDLKKYVEMQLDTFFPDKYKFKGEDVDRAFDLALDRTEYCFKNISYKSYTIDGQANFN